MGYQAQLVVRTRDPERAQIVDRVKELAELEGKTFSEKAIELFERGLGKMGDDGGSTDDGPDEDESTPEETAPPMRNPVPVELDPPTKLPTKDPDQRPEESAKVVAAKAADAFDARGAEDAAAELTAFFALAEPFDAAQLREVLQDLTKKDDYEAIMEALMETDEYREYRQRVVYS